MHEFWKHQDCLNCFFKPRTVAFDDDGRNAILWGAWLVQAYDCWFFTADARIVVKPEQYGKWKPYTPHGRIKL